MAAQPVVITTLLQRDASKAPAVAGGLDAGVMITGEPDDQAILAARSARDKEGVDRDA